MKICLSVHEAAPEVLKVTFIAHDEATEKNRKVTTFVSF